MRSAAWWSRGWRALSLLGVWAPLTVLAAGGSVDWQRQVLRVTGNGPPDVKASNPAQARLGAERSAKEHALADLLELAKGVPLRSDRTVGEEMAREETRQRIEEVLRGQQIIRKRYYSDGGVQWDVEVPLGALTQVLVTPEPETKPSEQGKESPAKASKATGLVVDARKLGMTPVLAPRLIDAASGERLYGLASLDAEARKSTGVAGFFQRLEDARKTGRVGAKPLVLEAARLEGSDLQLGPDAVKKLGELEPRLLAEGRVAILIQ
ncbi:hypothetical protein F0U62_23855 [Cystobacter fuscus]|uniref:hypothetical protein n=1 Tax=Cystobacter fuscus TaxID=43 RepID=UPI002B29DE71|nr:hypothetical protein F0U62_23855 [Cystobacter fuscus]